MVNGTTIAFNKQGIVPLKNRDFTNLERTIIMKHATKVVAVPKIISRGPTEDNRLASKHPNVNPNV